jgi:hypothetical protein
MMQAAKRAEPGSSTLIFLGRPGRRSMFSPMLMEVTMVTNTLSRPSRATLERYATVQLAGGRVARPDMLAWLEVAPKPWGRLGTTPHQLWNVSLMGGELLVRRHRDPSHEACRELLARGVIGIVAFVHTDGVIGLVMDIERAAKFSSHEDDAGIRLRKYVPFDRSRVVSGREEEVSGVTIAGDIPAIEYAAPRDVVTDGGGR